MRYRLIIRPEADIQEAFDWYERHVPDLGAEFRTPIHAAVTLANRNQSWGSNRTSCCEPCSILLEPPSLVSSM